MKKSKYLNKYDYINYYTKPKGMWFFTNNEIQSALETEIKKNHYDNDFEMDDENPEDDGEFDAYEFYKERLETNKNLDDDNPQIIQGRIIDVQSRKFIEQTFNHINKVIDLEEKYGRLSNEKLAEYTKQYLSENKNVILFQAVFISDNLITKPDAIVLDNGVLKVIETKGTTSSKFVHYLDLYFQMKVIEAQQYLIDNNVLFDYFLCLIDYCYLNKNEISFQLTENINLKKVVAIPTEHKRYDFLTSKELIYLKNAIKKGNELLNENLLPLKTKALMYDNFNDLDANIEISKGITKKAYLNSKDSLIKINEYFDETINELIEYKKTLNDDSLPYFKPSKNDKSPYKNCDFFPLERKLFSYQGYNLFDYSGNIANQTDIYLEKAQINDDINNFIKKPSKNPNVFLELFSQKQDWLVNHDKCKELLGILKSKKVYFDFETINTPIRVIDNSLPFMQVVTQCSIIKFDTKKDKLENLECDNLIVDPLKINLVWFKNVIDEIYWDKNNSELNNKMNDVSYIVYNKSFEKTRLLEIDKMINDKEYSAKIASIINNIYDLADFFKIKSEDPTYFMFFKELGGFYSIKKILPLIDKYAKHIYEMTKCLDYQKLEIGNGQVCQSETVKRFFKIIDDKAWNHTERQMQIYCENDVRAMIAVEYFINEFLNK